MNKNCLNCVLCGSKAKMMCQRCHEPYCSTECQATDWRRHKAICFQMPLVPMMDITMPFEDDILSNTWRTCLAPPSDSFFNVVVQHVDDSAGSQNLVVWLMEAKHQSSLSQMLEMLKRQVRFETVCNRAELCIDQLIVVATKENCYRAKILAINAEQVKIFLVDYGKQMQIGFEQIYPANNNLASLPALAFGAIITNATLQILRSKELTIRLNSSVPNNEGFYMAQLQTATTESSAVAVDAAETNNKILSVRILMSLDAAERYVLLQQCQGVQLYAKMDNKLQSIQYKANGIFDEGDIVAAYVQNLWQRAYVLAFRVLENVHLVYLIDKGSVSFCHKLTELPSDYKEIPPAVLIVHLVLPVREELHNALAELHLNANECLVKMFNFQSAGKILTLLELFNDADYDYWREKIDNGSHVHITHFISLSELWVNVTELQLLRQIIAKEAMKCESVSMHTKLRCNKLVVAPLPGSQNSYMRASILDAKQDVFEVCNVDTGLNSLVPRNKLRQPTALLRALPSKATYICLDLLHELQMPIPSSVEVMYQKYIAEQVEFELQLTGEQKTQPMANLIFVNDNRKILSKELLPLLNKSQEKNPKVEKKVIDVMPLKPQMQPIIKDKELLQKPKLQYNVKNEGIPFSVVQKSKESKIENEPKEQQRTKTQAQPAKIDMDVECLPLTEGENVKLFVIDSGGIEENILTVVPFNDGKTLQTVQEHRQMVLEFCEKVPPSSRGYTPRVNELCLAIFQEDAEWYRARCLAVHNGNIFTVEFIDYGNTSEVPMKDLIGPLPKELHFPQFSHICVLQDVNHIPDLTTKLAVNPILSCKVVKRGTAYYITPQ